MAISPNQNHPRANQGTMHDPTPSNPMIHTSRACGLKSKPAGRSPIRCPVFPSKTGLRRAGSAAASTVPMTAAPGFPRASGLLFRDAMIWRTSMVVFYGSALTLPRHFDRFQHSVDYLANLDALHLELRAEHHAVLEHRAGKGLHVLGQHELALLERRQGA